MVLSVVSHNRDDFNFGYDRKRKSSEVSMLVLELKKEAVSNYGLTVLNSFKLCWLMVWSGLYMLVPYCEAIVCHLLMLLSSIHFLCVFSCFLLEVVHFWISQYVENILNIL